MNKEEIISNETLLNYCYEKAKDNVLKTWGFLSNKQKKKINSNNNKNIVLQVFLKMHQNIGIDGELELIQKYYLNERVEEETKKCLKKWKDCTDVFISRMEFFITREIF